MDIADFYDLRTYSQGSSIQFVVWWQYLKYWFGVVTKIFAADAYVSHRMIRQVYGLGSEFLEFHIGRRRPTAWGSQLKATNIQLVLCACCLSVLRWSWGPGWIKLTWNTRLHRPRRSPSTEASYHARKPAPPVGLPQWFTRWNGASSPQQWTATPKRKPQGYKAPQTSPTWPCLFLA